MSNENKGVLSHELNENWNGTTSSSGTDGSIYERAIEDHSTIPDMKPDESVDAPESAECSTGSESPTTEKSTSTVWSCMSPGLANSSWFRMAAQCYRVEHLRDSQTHPSSDMNSASVRWSSGESLDTVHPALREWTTSTPREPVGQFPSLVTEIKFDSTVGTTHLGTAKFANYGVQSHGGPYDAAELSKPVEPPPTNLHHTLRDVIASTLDPAPNHSGSTTDSRRSRQESVFPIPRPDSSGTSRLTMNSSRNGPSLTVKIQMPINERVFTTSDTPHSSLIPHHHLSDELSTNNKHVHVKKPLNAFMLFMKEKRAQVMAECTLKESAAINQILGRKWHALSREEQAKYYGLARVEKERHQRMYPGWSARDNYACQVKRRKKRSGRENTRYSCKSANMTPRTSIGLSRQSFIPAPSVHKPVSVTVPSACPDDNTLPTTSRLHRHMTAPNGDSVYPTIMPSSQTYANDPHWSMETFKHNVGYEFHSTDAYLRPDAMHPLDAAATLPGRSTATVDQQDSFNCCLGCPPETVHPFDDQFYRSIRSGYTGTPFTKPNEESNVTSLKLALQQDEDRGLSPCLHPSSGRDKCPREDALMKFALPFQTKESLLYPPTHHSAQWQSDGLNPEIASAKFGLAYNERSSLKPHCAPVPDLLQSTQGSDLNARFSRSTSPSTHSLSDSLTSPPATLSSFNTSTTGATTADRPNVAASVAMAAAAAAAAFSLKELSSDTQSSYGYDADHYSPGSVYHASNGNLNRACVSPHTPTERGRFSPPFDRKNSYASQDNFRSYVKPIMSPKKHDY